MSEVSEMFIRAELIKHLSQGCFADEHLCIVRVALNTGADMPRVESVLSKMAGEDLVLRVGSIPPLVKLVRHEHHHGE